ncbi:group 1 truncated hemoglobin [Pseudenhygromyxa sp. WMMC2535]|uniref:group I truncated hemoglobin n=1 Tax=Pseudenhygromyxa sp. WMMC2535 TaxID=2712867 RepID=UPI00155665BA|nr:group 1 truncated hemoglobin [Pseudenhygromyxa sp. WMMC2535]NVB39433.1 group 1 truncated hemoglobin [Pseudenhygromyxa sp. WMMC2535]
MPHRIALGLCLGSALVLSAGCKGGEDGDDEAGSTLYERLGEEPGIEAVVTDAVVNRIAADPKINAYFLNDDVDVGVTITCLVNQLGNISGGPQAYPGSDCRDMKESHEGLGISEQDFLDLADHFVGALTDAGVAQADIDTIVAALVDMQADIVEDPSNDATIYQRVGRKPGIQAVVTDFYTTVSSDPAIMGLFAGADQVRFEACLTRQLCAIDGPCLYGNEATMLDPSYGGSVCKDMVSAHEGMTLTVEDFQAFADDLDMVLAAAETEISTQDEDAIMAVLDPLCAELVDEPGNCP